MSRSHGYMESLADWRYRMETGHTKSRPVTYRGVMMRSELEARFARHLEAVHEEWVYEPRNFGGKGGYLPDFQIVGAAHPTYIEVKPTLAEADAAMTKAAIIWQTFPDAVLIVAVEEHATFYAGVRGKPWAVWQERWSA